MLALTLAALVTSQQAHFKFAVTSGTIGAGGSELTKVLLVLLVRLVRLRVRVLALPQPRALLLISRLRLIEVTRSLPALPVSPSSVSGSRPGSVRSDRRLRVVGSRFWLVGDRLLIGSEVARNARVLLIRS